MMRKGFLVSILLLVAGLVYPAIPWALPNAIPASGHEVKLPVWLVLLMSAGIVWIVSDEGPVSAKIRSGIGDLISKLPVIAAFLKPSVSQPPVDPANPNRGPQA